jgi:hypothetical protein
VWEKQRRGQGAGRWGRAPNVDMHRVQTGSSWRGQPSQRAGCRARAPRAGVHPLLGLITSKVASGRVKRAPYKGRPWHAAGAEPAGCSGCALGRAPRGQGSSAGMQGGSSGAGDRSRPGRGQFMQPAAGVIRHRGRGTNAVWAGLEVHAISRVDLGGRPRRSAGGGYGWWLHRVGPALARPGACCLEGAAGPLGGRAQEAKGGHRGGARRRLKPGDRPKLHGAPQPSVRWRLPACASPWAPAPAAAAACCLQAPRPSSGATCCS